MSKTLKKVINIVLLTISIILSTYVFAKMSDVFLIQCLFFILVAAYEIVMQGVLSVGMMYFKIGGWRILSGIICMLLYLVGYVGIYAIPTATGFFLMHIDQQSIKAEIVETEYDLYKQILEIDLDSMESYNLQMKAESKTGYGRQSEKVSAEQNKIREGLENTLEKFREVSKVKKEVSIDVFASLSESFKTIREVSSSTIKFIMFMSLFFSIYLGLIFTHWDAEDISLSNKTSDLESYKVQKKLRNKTSQSSPRTSNKSFQKEESFPESSGQSSPESSESLLQEITPKVIQSSANTKSFKTEMERFIYAAIRDTGILNSPRRVSMLTGIPIDRCLEYRKRLDEMRIEGEPVVETVQGGSRVNFEKEEILERIREAI